jgi:hypothetical protein
MFLYEGRKVLWKGREVIVIQRVGIDRVKVASAANSNMIWIVKVADVQKKPFVF